MTNDRGRVLVDSAGQAAPGSRFATAERPEFGVALTEGRVDSRRRFSETAGGDLLLVTVPVVDGGEVVGAVRVSSSRESVVDRVHSSWLRLAAIGLAVVAGAFVLAWILATTVSRPLSRLRDTAGELGGGDLDARAPTDGPAELAALGVSFNRMADALGSSMRAQRDFVANASHQLRTPLTGIKLRLEAIRAEGGRPARTPRKRRRSSTASRRSWTTSSRSPARRRRRLPGSTVDLSSVAEDAVERWQAPAAEAEKTVEAGRRRAGARLRRPGRPRARRRQPDRERASLHAAGRACHRRVGVRERAGDPRRRRRRARDPRRGPRAGLRALLPGVERAPARPRNRARARDRRRARGALGRRGDPRRRPGHPGTRWSSARRLPIADPGFTDSEDGRCYVQSMRRVTTVLVALAGLALPVGLALAVYLSSASTIAATPASVPVATQGKADPKALDDDSKKSEKKKDDRKSDDSSSGTTTGDDHGGSERRLAAARRVERRHEHRRPFGVRRQRRLGRATPARAAAAPTTAPVRTARARTRDPARRTRAPARTTRAATTSPAGRLNQVFTPADRTFTGTPPALEPGLSTVRE